MAAFWSMGTAQIILIVSYPIRKKSRFWLLTCDPTKKCIMPSSREKHKGMIGRGNDLRLGGVLLGIQKFFKSLSNTFISFFPSAFGIETINKSIHSSSPLENHNRFENEMGKVYTRFQTKTAHKPYPIGRIWLIWGSIPLPQWGCEIIK